MSSLDKFASKLKFETAAAKDMTKYKYFLQQMKHSNEYKLNHTQTLEKPDHDRNTENDLQETDARLSRGDYTRLFGSRLKKSSDEKPSSSVKYNRLNGANVNFLTRGIFPVSFFFIFMFDHSRRKPFYLSFIFFKKKSLMHLHPNLPKQMASVISSIL